MGVNDYREGLNFCLKTSFQNSSEFVAKTPHSLYNISPNKYQCLLSTCCYHNYLLFLKSYFNFIYKQFKININTFTFNGVKLWIIYNMMNKMKKIYLLYVQKVESNHWAYLISYGFEVRTPHQWRSSTHVSNTILLQIMCKLLYILIIKAFFSSIHLMD